MNQSDLTLTLSLTTVVISIGAILLSAHTIWIGQKTDYFCRPKIRIVLSDYKEPNFIQFNLEQYKKKYFLSRTKWMLLTGGASFKSDKDSLIKNCVNSWKKAYPDAEVINNSTIYKLPEE